MAARAEAEVAAIAKLQAQQAAATAKYEAEKAANAVARAEAAAVAKVEQNYDAALAVQRAEQAALKRVPLATADASSDYLGDFMGRGKELMGKAGEMTSSGLPDGLSGSRLDFLSGVDGKGVVLPLIAGFALLSVTETVFNRMVDSNARKTGGKLSDNPAAPSANDIYAASKPGRGAWLKVALGGRPDQAAAPAAAPRAAPAGAASVQRSAPGIFFSGVGNLAKEPFGWCFGPPSPLYSNAGGAASSQPTAQPMAPPPPSWANMQAAAQEPWQTAATEATRDADEDVAKAAWLAGQSMQAAAPEPWQAAAPEPWQAAPAPEPWQAPAPEPWQAPAPEPQPVLYGTVDSPAPQPRGAPDAHQPQQAEDSYLRDPTSWSSKK